MPSKYLQLYPPGNRRGPWKSMVARWISFWGKRQMFRGYVSIRGGGSGFSNWWYSDYGFWDRMVASKCFLIFYLLVKHLLGERWAEKRGVLNPRQKWTNLLFVFLSFTKHISCSNFQTFNSSCDLYEENKMSIWAMKKNLGCLGYIRDYPTRLYGDF